MLFLLAQNVIDGSTINRRALNLRCNNLPEKKLNKNVKIFLKRGKNKKKNV